MPPPFPSTLVGCRDPRVASLLPRYGQAHSRGAEGSREYRGGRGGRRKVRKRTARRKKRKMAIGRKRGSRAVMPHLPPKMAVMVRRRKGGRRRIWSISDSTTAGSVRGGPPTLPRCAVPSRARVYPADANLTQTNSRTGHPEFTVNVRDPGNGFINWPHTDVCTVLCWQIEFKF